METIEALRKKITSTDDLHAIVRTMKTLAAVSIRHFEKAVESVSEYYRTVEMGLQAVMQSGPIELLPNPMGEDGGLCSLIFGSDQGLCGGFNDRIVSHALEEMDERESNMERRIVICIGARAAALLEEAGQPVKKLYSVPGSLAGVIPLMQQIVMKIYAWQREGRMNSLFLFHNRLLSSVSYQPCKVGLLPLKREWLQNIAGKKWPSHILPAFTMNRDKLFSSLVRQYIFVSLYRSFAESLASENASRLSSMQAAEKNIEERHEELSLLYRQQRQSSITAELLDIVSGFEALRSDNRMR